LNKEEIHCVTSGFQMVRRCKTTLKDWETGVIIPTPEKREHGMHSLLGHSLHSFSGKVYVNCLVKIPAT